MTRRAAITLSIVISILLLTSSVFSQTASTIPISSIEVGNLKNNKRVEGCICYFQFPADAKKRKVRYVMISDYASDGNPAWINIDGKDVELKMTKPGIGDPEIHVHDVGKKYAWEYEAPDIKVKVDFATSRTCGSKNSESCEITKYNGTLTVEKNGQKKAVKVIGECGC